jgi:hypothetical protein
MIKWIINKIIITTIKHRQQPAIEYLIKNKIFNKNILYYKNNNFQEEVWLDENFKPHFLSTQYKGIHAGFSAPQAFVVNDQIIKDVESQLQETQNNIIHQKNILEKLFNISIKIERTKK